MNNNQQFFVAQYDDEHGRPIVIQRCDTLQAAALAAQTRPDKNTYVLHVPSGLQRYLFGSRYVWLDANGREHPPPRGSVEEGR